jgi:hypothetical protein
MAYVNLTGQQVINRARSLADLPTTTFLSYQDELDSLNESYGDIYEKITESDNDFYVNEVTIQITSAYSVTDSMGDEYLVPLPADFFKLRACYYYDGAYWTKMDKFHPDESKIRPSSPMYRFKGQNLWLIGMGSVLPSSIKLSYYPPAQYLTKPDKIYTFGLILTQAQIWALSSLDYTTVQNTMLYYTGDSLIADSLTLNSQTSLLTGQASAITNIDYYRGYVYYIQNGNIYAAPTDLLTAPIVPVAIVSTALVQNFTIANNLIYFYNGIVTNSCSLTGTGVSLVQASFTNDYNFVQGVPVYLTSTGTINIAGTILSATTYNMLTTDGTNLYVLDAAQNLHQLQLALTLSVWSIALDTIIASGVVIMSPYTAASTSINTITSSLGAGQQTGRIGVLTNDPYIQSISTALNSVFSYPYNELNEIISYQCAIDFKRKQSGDTSLLERRVAELWQTFSSKIKRDDFQLERIGNWYGQINNNNYR